MKDILNRLEEYSKDGYVPMHMPGGKRNTDFSSTSELDITEIDGFDNIHNAEGIIKDASERAASIYGADRTLFLVNGSTAGILASICGTVRKHSKIIVARNCHVSVYNAVLLAEAEPIYVMPDVDQATGIYKGLTCEKIRKCVEDNPDVAAVVITSPTYEGVVSQTRQISEYLHEKGIVLIVDEAHGAHFKFSKEFPDSAVDCGADLVINSIHKTLPALTQTALLHISGNYVDIDRVERYWNIYQTTSPSYILMASIDRCMSILEADGQNLFKDYVNRLKNLRNEIGKLENIKLLDSDDISKIILICQNGKYLYNRLLKEHKVQLEMASFRYVIAMTSIADKEEYYYRFLTALQMIDKTWKCNTEEEDNIYFENNTGSSYSVAESCSPDMVFIPAKALELQDENGYEDFAVNCDEVCGKISLSSVLIYPPGMPVVNIGERVTEEVIAVIRKANNAGLEVTGLKEGKIRCLR